MNYKQRWERSGWRHRLQVAIPSIPQEETILDGLFREAWLAQTLYPKQTLTPDASQGVKHVDLAQPQERISPRETLWVRASHSAITVCTHFFWRLSGIELLTRPKSQQNVMACEEDQRQAVKHLHEQQVTRTGHEMKAFYVQWTLDQWAMTHGENLR